MVVDDIDDLNAQRYNSNIEYNKSTYTRTYSINAFVNDINGREHRFDGEITVTYSDGTPTIASFTGFYDGQYVENATIILYDRNNTTYGHFSPESGLNPDVIFVNMIAELQ